MDDGRVVTFHGITKLDLDPDRVLHAPTGKLKIVLIIGITHEGEEYFAGSSADVAEMNWLADRFKHFLQLDADRQNA